jgi:hypothetical protein
MEKFKVATLTTLRDSAVTWRNQYAQYGPALPATVSPSITTNTRRP